MGCSERRGVVFFFEEMLEEGSVQQIQFVLWFGAAPFLQSPI